MNIRKYLPTVRQILTINTFLIMMRELKPKTFRRYCNPYLIFGSRILILWCVLYSVCALAEISRKFTPTARRILAALKSIYIPVVALRDKLKRIECIKTFFLCSFRNFIQAYNTNAKRFIFQNIRYRGLKDLIFSLFLF